jgi:hypothetical protein
MTEPIPNCYACENTATMLCERCGQVMCLNHSRVIQERIHYAMYSTHLTTCQLCLSEAQRIDRIRNRVAIVSLILLIAFGIGLWLWIQNR